MTAVRPMFWSSITPAVGVLKLKYFYGLVRGFFVKGNLHYQTKPGNTFTFTEAPENMVGVFCNFIFENKYNKSR